MADVNNIFEVTGNGDVVEPETGVLAIGSGGNYAQGKCLPIHSQSLHITFSKSILFS